jgi:co-chaperonin GroES (HSP10)
MRVPRMGGKRTLVKPYDKEKTQGGIIIPDDLKGESALEGTIIAVGNECIDAHVGDEIVFAPYGKYKVPVLEGEYKGYLIVNEDDILLYWDEIKDKKDKGEK